MSGAKDENPPNRNRTYYAGHEAHERFAQCVWDLYAKRGGAVTRADVISALLRVACDHADEASRYLDNSA
jgi:hypothetical protein